MAPCQQPQQESWLMDPSLVFPRTPPALPQALGRLQRRWLTPRAIPGVKLCPCADPSAQRQDTGRGLRAAGARAQPAGGDGATEMTFRSGGSISRQPCRGRLSEKAIRSVRCLRCHYTCDACLYTRLIINGVRFAANGGHSQANPAPVALCSDCCQK